MGSRRPKSAILAVFGGLEIGLRCAGYAGWVCIRSIYDLRRPPGYSMAKQAAVEIAKALNDAAKNEREVRIYFVVTGDW